MRPSRYISLIILFMLLMASCNSPRDLARRFITSDTDVHVLILPPGDLLKNYYPIHPDSIPQDAFSDFALEEGQFLHQVVDSLVLKYFMETLRHELQRFDVKVYTPQTIDSFFELDTNSYIFSVAQIQLMEYLDEKIDYSVLDTVVYEAGTQITTLVMNTWFEYTELNHPERPMQVLFSMKHRRDFIDGRFRKNWLTGEVTYEYRPYRLTIDDVYDLTWEAARQNAQYIFDHLLNQYVIETSGRDDIEYFQYDRQRHAIRRAYNDRFYQFPSASGEDDIQEP